MDHNNSSNQHHHHHQVKNRDKPCILQWCRGEYEHTYIEKTLTAIYHEINVTRSKISELESNLKNNYKILNDLIRLYNANKDMYKLHIYEDTKYIVSDQ
jgi:hypothetical protein